MEQLLVNRFRVLSELGRGGMGTVYRVADTLQGDREMALKTIRVEGGLTSDLMLRFKEEFRAMVKLQHPNTIEVYDYGQMDDSTQYLTMEIVPGHELTDLIRGQQMPYEDIYRYLIQLLQALGFIHSRLYVHRDIKAENIRTKLDGTLKLMDFGLMDRLGIPSSGKLTGTPGYLPPEVPKGGVIDASSDLYSVGCLAYEMVTGQLPFSGGILEVVKAHINQPADPMSFYRPDVPERLEAIVAKLLQKDQKFRYQDAPEVIDDLADLGGLNVARSNIEQRKSYLTSSVLVGRDKELGILQEAFQDIKQGKGRSVFVGAPAGIGKTRLVKELLLQAKLDEAPVLHGQCLETEMAPYDPMVQALRSIIPHSTSEEIKRFGPFLARILPELVRHGVQPAPTLEPSLEKMRFNETVLAWLSAVSERTPLVLFFDDLHWCDLQSLDVLNHIIRQLADLRLLCVATFRSDEAPVGSPLWYTIEEGGTRYLKLNAFNLAQVMMLLQATLKEIRISKEFSEFLFDSTAGNAFFLTEVMRYLMEEGVLVFKEGAWNFPSDLGNLELPKSVEATVVRRLSQLSKAACDLASVASVLGRYQEREMFLSVSGLDEDSLFARLDELFERQFIVKDGDRYTFPHDRVREALYESMPAEQRCTIHQKCAEYLERLAAGNLDGLTSELAYHFDQGRDRSKAYRYLRKAGDQAMATGALAKAIDLWRKADTALAEIDLPDKEVHQVSLWWVIGGSCFEFWPAVAIEAYQKLIPVLEAQANVDAICALLKKVAGLIKKLPPTLRDPILAQLTKPVTYKHQMAQRLIKFNPLQIPSWVPNIIESHAFLSAAYGFGGRPMEGLKTIERVFSLMPFTETPLEGALFIGSCVSLVPAGHFDEILRQVELARDLLLNNDLTGQPAALAARVGVPGYPPVVCFQGNRFKPEDMEGCIKYADAIPAPNQKNISWNYLTIYYAWTGRYEEAMQIIELSLENCRKYGAPPYQWTLYTRPYLLWQRGEFEEAKALINQALRYPHLNRDVFAEQSVHILKGQLHLSLEEWDDAQAEFDATEERGKNDGLDLIYIQSLLGKGQLAILRGDFASAREPLVRAGQISASGDARNPLHQALACRWLGELTLREGDLAEAQRFFDQALAIVSEPEQDNIFEQGQLHLSSGALELAREDKNAAKEAFKKAGELFHQIKNRYWINKAALQIEALNKTASPTLKVGGPVQLQGHPKNHLLSDQWRERLLGARGSALFPTLVSCGMEALQADEASLYVIDSELRWVASTKKTAACEMLKINRGYLEQVQQQGKGLQAIDMPEEMAIGLSSRLEVEIPSILVSPIVSDGRVAAILYLTRWDISDPFSEEDLELLDAFCQMSCDLVAQHFSRQTLPLSERQDLLVSQLRTTLKNQSLSGQKTENILISILGEVATKLELDEISLLSGDDSRWIASYPVRSSAPEFNASFVAQAFSTQQSLCAIEMPEELSSGSNLDLEVPSVAVTPAGPWLMYCVRKNLDAALNEEDLPALEACVQVLAEAMADFQLREPQLDLERRREG
ncbi:MAG TPA: hypothetical protein DD435_16750 [Cyanobacteria bacterium UBA8530]|nr:hypothetical protein [Cyanobacteria bacterium UBA8530]